MENIIVHAKLETINEKKDKSNFIIEPKKITNKKTKEIFYFDSIINQSLTNKDIFKKLIKNNLSYLLKGINISIISYGQINIDKNYLFNGLKNSYEGLIQFSIKELFNLLKNKNSLINKYEIKISYIEINDEEINDLIDISKKNLEIKDIPNKGIVIKNLSEIIILNDLQVEEILNKTEINNNNKSHKIFKISIEYCIADKNNKIKEKQYFSSLNFVDLSRIENANKNKEKENNNKSLSALNSIINKLNRSNNNNFVNYKESKLTRLLQEFFDIKSKIIIICSIIDDKSNYSEVLNILNMAKKLKNIKINNKNNIKGKSIMESKTLKNKIKFLEKIIKDKKSLKEKNKNIKNKYKNNNNDLINNKQIMNLEKEVSLLKEYLLYNNNNEEYYSDINNSNIDITDWASDKGFNEKYNSSSFNKNFNLSSIRGSQSALNNQFFNSPFSYQKNISDIKDNNNNSNLKYLLSNKNNLQKNICMTEMRQNYNNIYFNNSALGKTEPPIYNFIENSNMKIPLPDLNLNNNFINNDCNYTLESNYLIKENEELKNNIEELKKTYNEIVQCKEDEINLINQNHDMTMENCEKIIKNAENSYINLKSDYNKALEEIKIKENELNDLKQKNINQNSSIKYFEKELNKVGDFNYANEIKSKYNDLLEENKILKEKGNSINSKLKEENELLKKNIGMIEDKYKEKCKEVNKNQKIINETKKQNEKELQKYKIEIKNYIAIFKKNKDIKINDEGNNINININKDKIKEYEDKINKLIQENK